ncbi:LacI family DNA-binding transcriptional regulator [Nonomuraea sp. NPDC049141]|uniref:LacI family DNA-binding transcriptional regulator n=1 Tax=Nonomuraea sp. NPDC049141 TaxID=3155500 RepID=UPI0033C0E426
MARSASGRPVTIIEVAKQAGVSISTVSRVMNGNHHVDPAIAGRVRAVAAELRYSASPLARSLVLGRTQRVAIMVPDLENPTFQSVLRGLTRAAAKDNYHVLVADSLETAGEESTLASEARRCCDAIALCAPRMPEDQLRALLPELAPVVLINRESPYVLAPTLTADYEAGIQSLARHLHQLGHRRIAYLEGNPDSASNAQRLSGLTRFRAEHPDADVIGIPCGVTFEHGHAVADAVIASGATGVLGFNDLVAMGLLSGLNERGVRVPEQLSLTGFDDIPFAKYMTPALTTASVPVVELGEEAWKRLHALLNGERPDHDLSFRPRIEIRGSTGPAPAS